MDLRKPEGRWKESRKAWKRLTDILFAQLQDSFAQGLTVDFPAQQGDLETWKPLIQSLKDQKQQSKWQYQWEVAYRMLLCAEQANKHPKRDWNEIDRLSLAVADMPEMLKGYEDWGVDCVRLLLGYMPPAIQRLDLPVALSDELTSTQGSLATLRLEMVPLRGGGAYHYPPHSLLTYSKPDFSEALSTAWTAANTLAQQQAAANHVAGRWQILLSGHPAKEIGGRSASAAAALGWYHLLRGTKLDDSIIVLAQIDHDGQLDGVGGVPAKVKAIVEDGRFDTIVVANAKNQREAEEVLRQTNMLSQIRVVEHITLESLVSVRSWLVEEVLDYLDNLASRVAKLPAYYPAHLRTSEKGKTRFDDIRQMVQVVEDRSAFSKWVAEERERARAAGLDVDPVAYAPNRARPERRAYDTQPSVSKLLVSWNSEAGERFKRAVILADPGFGKTWLLRYEARRLAREEAQHLRQGSKSLSEIILPIFMRLSEVNRDDRPLEESLLALIGRKRSEMFRRLAREKMESEHCAILLDAWDEVPIEIPQDGQPIAYHPRYRQRLGQRLSAFADNFPRPRLLMTSRIVGYTESPIPDAQELELIAFETSQVEAFVRIWVNDNALTNQFMAMLRQNHTVRGLTRIPLMLTLVCRAYQENQLAFPSRRVDLYDSCLRGLLRDWKEEKERREISDAEVDAELELLQAVSYTLFAEGYEQFKASLLRKKIIHSLKKLEDWHDLYGTKPTTFIKILKRDGILISAGEDRNAPLLFLHRTFHEYLAARALAHRANEEGWHMISELMEEKVWLPNWQEVIVLLAGQLDDPTFLLESLADKGQDDYFRHRLALATLCLPEITNKIRNEQITIIDQITTDIFNLCWQHQSHETLNDIPHLMRALPALAVGGSRVYLPSANNKMALRDALINLLNDKNSGTRNTAAQLIGYLGSAITTDAILEVLAGLLRDHYSAVAVVRRLREAAATPIFLGCLADLLGHFDRNVRFNAINAVKELGEAAAMPVIVERLADLLRDSEVPERERLIDVVGKLGKAAAMPAILERLADLLYDSDSNIRKRAIDVVGKLGKAAVAPFILERLADLLHDSDSNVRKRAIGVVGSLGEVVVTDTVLERLADLLNDPDEEVCIRATRVVGGLGKATVTSRILEGLADLLHHPVEQRRESAISAVGWLGEVAATPRILEGLAGLSRHSDEQVRKSVAETVSKLGEAATTRPIPECLLNLLCDPNEQVRKSAVETVGKLGEVAVTPRILECLINLLYDSNFDVRWSTLHIVGKLRKVVATPAFLSSLADLLSDVDLDESTYLTTANVVDKLGEAAATEAFLERLADLLRHPDSHVCYRAIEIVGKLGNAAATPLILECLANLFYDPNSHMRSSAISAVGKLGKAAATPLILECLVYLFYDSDWRVRSSAIDAVGKLGEAAASALILELFADLLRDPDWSVRSSTEKAVSKLGEAAATPPILEGLADLLCDSSSNSAPFGAIEAVGKLGEAAITPPILECLADLLRDPDEGIRINAAKAVEELGKAALTPAILEGLADLLRDENNFVRIRAADVVGKLGESAATPLILERFAELLCSSDSLVRSRVAEVTGKLGKAAATPAFLERLANLLRDSNQQVRSSALKTVWELGEVVATEAFLECLADLLRDSDKEVRDSALKAVRSLEKAAATPAILKSLVDLLSDGSYVTREVSAQALNAMMRSGVRVFEKDQGFEARMVARSGWQERRDGKRGVSWRGLFFLQKYQKRPLTALLAAVRDLFAFISSVFKRDK